MGDKVNTQVLEALRRAKDDNPALLSPPELSSGGDESTLRRLCELLELQRVQLLQNACAMAQEHAKRRGMRKRLRAMEQHLQQQQEAQQQMQQQRDQMEFQLRQAVDEAVLWQTRYEQQAQMITDGTPLAAETHRAMELERKRQLVTTQALEHMNESLRRQLEQLQDQLTETLQSNNTKSELDTAHWKEQLSHCKDQMRDLKNQLNAAQSRLLEKQMELQLEQAAHKALQTRLRELQISSMDQVNDREVHIKQLVLQLGLVQQKLISVETERRQSIRRMAQQIESLMMQQEEILLWKNSALKARQAWKEWQDMLQDLSKRHAAQLKQYARLRVVHQQEIARTAKTQRQLHEAEVATQQIRSHAMQLRRVLKSSHERDCRYGALLRETQAHNRRLHQAMNQSKQQLKRVLGRYKEQKQCLDKQQLQQSELKSCFQSSVDDFHKKIQALAKENQILERELDELSRFCQECSTNEAKLRQELEELEINGQRELLVFG